MKIFLKNKKVGLIILFTIFYLLFFVPAHAQTNELMTNLINGTPVLPQADLVGIIFRIIQYVLMFVGVIAVVIIIYGGFIWMTAGGNDEKVNKAKKILVNGLIGLIVIILSYAIVGFAIGRINQFTQPPAGQTCQPNQCVAGCWRCDSQGSGTIYDVGCPPCGGGGQNFVVRWTWPNDGQENIMLCSLLQAGFNDQLDEDSINSQTIKITVRDALKIDGEACNDNTECKSGKCLTGSCSGNVVAGQFTVVEDVFKFKADQDFAKDTWYRFLITTGVRSANGLNLNAQRNIDFKTGNQEDQTPPIVENVYPENNEENVCLLEPIQSIFSEAMDVTTLVNIEALITDPIHEFNRSVPNVKTLEATPKNSYRSFQKYNNTLNANIITDICGNKLDGDRDGNSEGSPTDDYLWSFTTGNNLKCQPIIESINPSSGLYGDELIINGSYFRLSGEVVFNRDVYPQNFCFNANNFPNQTCLVSWSSQQIKIKIPAAGGASQGATSGPVKVIVGGTSSNSKTFNLESPYIQSFTPISGGKGQAITLRGINFGNISNKIYFVSKNDPARKFQGDLICAGTGWRDSEIIVAVPQFIDLGSYYLQVEKQNGKVSNVRLDETFEIDNQQPGPTLCDIREYCADGQVRGGKPSDVKVLSGYLFGTSQGLVNFNSTSAQITSWDDGKINIVVPQINSGSYQVKVVLPNFKESNPLSFVSPCFEKNGFGEECFLDANTCLLEKCEEEYDCKSSSNGSLECRCCCSANNDRCPSPLQCNESQPCYKSQDVEIGGACCGCTGNNQCQNNEICKSQGSGQPNCCFACQLGDESKSCKGGECCSNDCANFTNSTECSKHDSCSWNGINCQGSYDPFCCLNGRCLNHQCVSLCGNGQIDGSEECDPGPPENLNGKTCSLLGYEGGTLHCDGTCKFQVNDCAGAGGAGDWGEKCKSSDVSYCTSGRDDCSLALGAKCVQNVTLPPTPHCACCCQPGDVNKGIADSCKVINSKLACSLEKACGEFGQRGLCCGCSQDSDCGDFMVCSTDKCCYSLPAPTDLKFLTSSKDQINLSWKFSDANNFGTHFEVYKKDFNDSNFIILATCEISDADHDGVFYECNNNDAELGSLTSGFYNFKDKRGNFEKDKDYTYKLRTIKTTTSSHEAGPAIGQISGTSSCQINSDCPGQAPCCQTDSHICVDWGNCQGKCQIGNNCQAPSIKFAVHDFLVTTDPEIGPCLIGINPRSGKINNSVILDGLRFGAARGLSEVTFASDQGQRVNANYSLDLSWTDRLIDSALVPHGAADGEVKVVVNNRESNGIWFDFITQTSPPGEKCYENACPLEIGECTSPYTCLVNSSDCRCCCDPNASSDICKQKNTRLECRADQSPCSGANRGLCCGCQSDADCGDIENVGCGIAEPSPKCCHNRPVWESISFCEETSSNSVKVNSDISLNFTDKMDFSSLNNDNLKVSHPGNCLNVEEGQTVKGRCYLNGNIINSNQDDKTNSFFIPKNCQLQPDVNYQVEIVVDQNGLGVRSEKGTAVNNSNGTCSWDAQKKCQIKVFSTRNDQNNLCKIQWIDVQPRAQALREVNQTAVYQAIARDQKNKAVCVKEFNWQSSDEAIATVTTPGLLTTATSKGIGKATIIASLTTADKTCLTLPTHTCGLLNVSLEGPKVVEQKTCETCNLGGQSPSPWKFSTDACLAAQITARFDKSIKPSTLNLNTIKIIQCLGEDFTNPQCAGGSQVNGEIEIFDQGFSLKPTTQLLPEKVYQINLLSGSNGIKDINNLELDGNGNGIQDGTPSDDYVWYFKTKADPTCPLSKICVNPSSLTLRVPEDVMGKPLNGRIYTQNCNYLNANDSTWQWSSLNTLIARVNPAGPGSWTRATGRSLGQTKVNAIAEGKQDQASIIVATHPVLEETYPSGSSLCLNSAIYAKFDQEMEQGSFTNNFKVESEDASGVGAPQKIDETSNFSLRFVTEKNQTVVYFVPQASLKSNTKYYFKIYGSNNIEEKTGVESVIPYKTKMVDSQLWNFTTGTSYCRLERVEVGPAYNLFTLPKETKDFTAKAFYHQTEIQGIPGFYDWSWSWRSTDQNIAKITTGANLQNATVEAQAKNGLTSIIAQAKITEDKIFTPSTVNQYKEGAAQVEVWLCEDPWPSTAYPISGETYQDNSTNFSFRYCRDAGVSGLIDDLPILKGGVLANPPSEPGLTKLKEHFFTVYDGSISFFYDGAIFKTNPGSRGFAVNKSGYNNSNYNLFGDNNGQVTSDVTQLVGGGKFGDGLSFGGGSSHLRINYNDVNILFGRNETIETDKFTLEAWVNTKESLPVQYIFQKGENLGTESDNGYGLDIRADGKVYFWVFDKKGDKAEISQDFAGINQPVNWQHLAASYDGKNLKLYVNGILSVNQASTKAGGISQADLNLLIGDKFKGTMDDIVFWQKVLTQDEINKHLKSSPAVTLGDVVGFKVFSNFDHLKPEEWYKKYAPGNESSGSGSSIDNYKSYQVGRTVYVAATNVSTLFNNQPKIYTNLYLVSKNDNALSGTNQIFTSILNNWKFNINLEDPEPATPQHEDKLKIINDLTRIYNLKEVWQTLEKYKDINTKEPGLYPRLGENGGTWVVGMSTSKWPSWTAQTGLGQDLVRAGLSILPLDPVDAFSLRNNCSQNNNKYSCCADCPSNNPDCSKTCYNSQLSKYEGINPCNVYQYMAEGTPVGKAYGFYTTFEYSSPDAWQHQCGNLGLTDCSNNAFCEEGSDIIQPGKKCKNKTLYYAGNPCTNNGNECSCFNAKFYSVPSFGSQTNP
jgi:hypothetical protein